MSTIVDFCYRLFVLSSQSLMLYPKSGPRLLIYLLLALPAPWVVQQIYSPQLPAAAFERTCMAFMALLFINQMIWGECSFRILLLTERGRGNISMPPAIRLLLALAASRVVWLMVDGMVYLLGWTDPDLALLFRYWWYATAVAMCMVELFWLLDRELNRRFSPLFKEETYFSLNGVDINFVRVDVLAKLNPKYREQSGNEDDIVDDIPDEPIADSDGNYAAEALHEYRMKVAKSYLDKPPFGLGRPDFALPEGVVAMMYVDRPSASGFSSEFSFIYGYKQEIVEKEDKDGEGNVHLRLRFHEKGVVLAIPPNYKSMNTLLIEFAKLVAPHYHIRQCRFARNWEYQLFFMILPMEEWDELECQYGAKKMNQYFTPVDERYQGLRRYDSFSFKVHKFLKLPENRCF